MRPAPIRSFEYKNAFLYVVIREEPGPDADSYVYCCGINLSRFCRLAWRKGGICSNPALRGIQLLHTHVSAFAAKQGMIVKKAEGIDPAPITPPGNGWYHQDPLRLEQSTPERIRELLEFSVMDLVRTVLSVCVPDVQVPAAFLDETAMQKFLESLSVAEERERVFDRFYRHAGSETGGSGLGLAIVRRVVEHHGGSIELGDNSPTGLRGTVRLPLARPPRA